jgi:endonuclease/exonuclease/phosphatase (EEP) superfamily protein YafD
VVPIATIHLSRGERPGPDRLRRRRLAKAVHGADMQALILAGDLNLVPWSGRLRSLDSGLAPVKRVTAAFSWPARWAGQRFPFPLVPIDHLYAGPVWKVASVQQLPRTGSDHYPIRVELIWQR